MGTIRDVDARWGEVAWVRWTGKTIQERGAMDLRFFRLYLHRSSLVRERTDEASSKEGVSKVVAYRRWGSRERKRRLTDLHTP